MARTQGSWKTSSVVRNAIVAASNPRDNLLGLDVDGTAIFMEQEDADLAAAAPDLLAACKQVLRDEMGIEDTELYDVLTAAIDKAEPK